jgi:hypothetical protein
LGCKPIPSSVLILLNAYENRWALSRNSVVERKMSNKKNLMQTVRSSNVENGFNKTGIPGQNHMIMW